MAYLVPADSKWAGTVGLAFKPDEFEAYLKQFSPPPAWPQFIALHNTGQPTLAQWKLTPGGIEQRLKNLTHYYRDQNGWKAGPHLFVDDEHIWVFTPLAIQGVHSPSWNRIAWGVEMAGDYDREPFTGGVRENAIAALAALCEWKGLDPDTIRLHKEDPKTTHDCPGKNVVKADVIAAVKRSMLTEGEHATDAETAPAPLPAPATHVVKAGDTLWGISRRYAISVADLTRFNGGSDKLADGQVLQLTDTPPASPPPAASQQLAAAQPKASLNLAKFIGAQEAFVSVRYLDKGKWAIGFGHNDSSLGPDAKITIERGLEILETDLSTAVAAVLKAVKVPLAQNEQDALTDFAFNVGGGALAGASWTAKLNAGDRQGAADGLLKWNKARNKDGVLEVLPGLTKRREAERRMFLTGDYGDISTYPHYDGDPTKTKPVRKPFPA